MNIQHSWLVGSILLVALGSCGCQTVAGIASKQRAIARSLHADDSDAVDETVEVKADGYQPSKRWTNERFQREMRRKNDEENRGRSRQSIVKEVQKERRKDRTQNFASSLTGKVLSPIAEFIFMGILNETIAMVAAPFAYYSDQNPRPESEGRRDPEYEKLVQLGQRHLAEQAASPPKILPVSAETTE